MTRKRRDDQGADSTTGGDHQEHYGYGQDVADGASFPSKKKFRGDNNDSERGGFGRGGFRGRQGRRGGGRREGGYRGEGDEQYGYQGGEHDSQGTSSNRQKLAAPFNKELHEYLSGMLSVVEEGPLDDDTADKVMEEVNGQEEYLLQREDGCKLVESVIDSNAKASEAFLSVLVQLPDHELFRLCSIGCSCRVIERLLQAMVPIRNAEAVQAVVRIVDLLLDRWDKVIADKNVPYLVRTVTRISAGLYGKPKKESKNNQHEREKTAYVHMTMPVELSALFKRICDVTVNYDSIQGVLDRASVSLIVQEVLLSGYSQNGNPALASGFVRQARKAVEQHPSTIIRGWKGKNSSRVWELIVFLCDESAREGVWTCVHSNLDGLLKSTSFFVLQKLLQNVRTEKLASAILDELLPLTGVLIEENRPTLISAMADCVLKHTNLQERLVAALTDYFDPTGEDKKHLLVKVLSLHGCMPSEFSADDVTVQGSVIVESLLKLPETKSLCESMTAMSSSKILALSTHDKGSHVVESFIKSDNVDPQTKNHIFDAFRGHWEQLIDDKYGSRVFETMWDSLDFRFSRKLNFMKEAIALYNASPFWKFMLLRTEMRLFQKEPQTWAQKFNDKSVSNRQKQLAEREARIQGSQWKAKKIEE